MNDSSPSETPKVIIYIFFLKQFSFLNYTHKNSLKNRKIIFYFIFFYSTYCYICKPKSRNHEVTSMMNTNEHDLRMAQHLQNTLAVNNINDFDPNSQDQHHSRSQNNKNYRTPTSTPSFSNQNKQLVKTGYEEVSQPVGFKHNVKISFFYLEMNQLCFNC